MARRILTVSWEYPPIVEGGLGRHVRKLSEQLVAQGTEVHVLTRGAPGIPAEETLAGVHVHRVPEAPVPSDLDLFVAWVQRMDADMLAAGELLLRRVRPDLVHGHDWLVAPAAAGLADAAGVPYVTTIHATEHGRHQGRVAQHPQAAIHRTETWMARRADAVITCSQYMREHVADVFGLAEDRVTAIPNGVDPEELAVPEAADLAVLRERFAARDERLVLLVGRLVYEKGFQLALEALPTLIRRLDGGLRVVVAGSGPHQAELEGQVARLGLAGHVTFTGWIGDDALHGLYRVADLCVVPSLYEPFGLVALEAMASGCACIVADTGGLREVVPTEDVGLRFRSRDPRSLARMAERVLGDPALRERLVAEAATHVRSFDWADVAARTAALHEALLAPPRARGARAGRPSSA